MKETGYSPYLPGWEYVPDGEPHLFGDRLYVFGSHDRFGGNKFCEDDYVCWSAPVSDLTDWTNTGVIYKKTQDPDNQKGKLAMWAPDVARGADGRFYLYYCLENYPKIGVAVSDKPDGQYEFLGYVHDKNGAVVGKRPGDVLPFDPGIFVDDDNSVHLYSGQAPMEVQTERKLNPLQMAIAKLLSHGDHGVRAYSYHMELMEDMVTLKTEPQAIVPNVENSAGTGFEGHEFFEASSMRKFNGKYYFIYSSVKSNELCYAISDRPDGGFTYCGTLISNGDIGLHEDITMNYNSKPSRVVKNYTGNTHGSIEKIGEDYYVFYHRQTNRNMHTRQGTVEKIFMTADGKFPQVEMTSEGFYGELKGKGSYDARIACNLWSKEGCVMSAHPAVQNKDHPAFTEEKQGEKAVQYIENMKDGATAGFKYFDLSGTEKITLTLRGKAEGEVQVLDSEEGNELSIVPVTSSSEWKDYSASFRQKGSLHSGLFMVYKGTGSVDFLQFTLE